jgi:hypothetical protein
LGCRRIAPTIRSTGRFRSAGGTRATLTVTLRCSGTETVGGFAESIANVIQDIWCRRRCWRRWRPIITTAVVVAVVVTVIVTVIVAVVVIIVTTAATDRLYHSETTAASVSATRT